MSVFVSDDPGLRVTKPREANLPCGRRAGFMVRRAGKNEAQMEAGSQIWRQTRPAVCTP